MDPKIIKSISAQIYRQFPEMVGVQPKMRSRPSSQTTGSKPAPTFLLTYTAKVSLNGGKNLPRSVRVVVDANGKVIKISTSH